MERRLTRVSLPVTIRSLKTTNFAFSDRLLVFAPFSRKLEDGKRAIGERYW